MAYPLAGGTIWPAGSANPSPAYSGTFIPTIWSSKIIAKFYDKTVLAVMSNTDYEGEIKGQGDKVTIRTRPTITIRDYLANSALTLERPASNVIDLLIDKGKYFATILDDVMKVQSDIELMNLWADDAAEQLKLVVDSEVLLGLIAGGVIGATTSGATAGRISVNVNLGVTTAPLLLVAGSPAVGQTNVIDFFTRLGQVLDEQNIPETGRYAVIPAWVGAVLKRSDLKDASIMGDGTSAFRSGRIGRLDRFDVYVSNRLPTGVASGLAASEFSVFAGHPHALTFASQLTQMETIRAESTFGNIMRGLTVFGSKVIDNTAIAHSVIKAV